MLFQIDNATTIDTERDLKPVERHIVQKLLGWKQVVNSVDEFRQKRRKALYDGWNGSGPVRESSSLARVADLLEKEVAERLRREKYKTN